MNTLLIFIIPRFQQGINGVKEWVSERVDRENQNNEPACYGGMDINSR